MLSRLENLVVSRALPGSRCCARNRASLACIATVALACLTVAGCGGGEPERTPVFKTGGKVTFNSQPVPGAFLVLHPKTPAKLDDPRPSAQVKPDGTFEATTFDSADGAPAGDYVVTVEYRKLIQYDGNWQPGPNVLPPKYENPATSDIFVHVAEGENKLQEIVLR